MAYEIVETSSFSKELKQILKKFPRSKDGIQKHIRNLASNPHQGSVVPGFPDLEVRKIRIGLKEYRISPRNGLRLLFIVKANKVIPCHIYHKADYKSEHKELNKLKKILKDILREL